MTTVTHPFSFLMAYPLGKTPLANLANAKAHGHRILIDSGAFTAWKKGRTLTVAEYTTFIKALDFTPDHYLSLDVVGDPVQTERNDMALRDAGLSPVAVYTRGSPIEYLDRAYERSPALVAIGGLVGTPNREGYVKHLMKHVGTRPVHLLGFVRAPFIMRYRPYSVDSSSATAAGVWGRLALYAGGGKFLAVNRPNMHTRPSDDFCALLRTYGVEPSELAREQAWRGGESRSVARRLGIQGFLRFALDAERLFGTKVYIATTDDSLLVELLRVHPFEQARIAALAPAPQPMVTA